MAKKGKVNGAALWDALQGKKESLSEVVEVELGDVKGEFTVVFRDADVVQAIEEEYSAKMPPKPTINLDGLKEPIEIPSEKYKRFNDHPLAKEWMKEVKPINKEKVFRIAYEFLADDEKPADTPEEGIEIMQERLRLTDAINIMQAGMEVAGFSSNLGKQENDS